MKYYKNSIPNIGDIVYGQVKSIDEKCIYVDLIEYENLTGLIIIADATIRKKRKSYCLMKINKKYPLVIKNMSDDGEKIELSFRYVDKQQSKDFLDRITKYQKSLRIFKNFLNILQRKFSDEFYKQYAEKTIWNVNKDELYDYLVSHYMGKNNLEKFDLTEEETEILFKSLEKFFGKLKIESKYTFSLKNPNFDGLSDIKKIFTEVKDKYNTIVYVNSIPEYYISIVSDNEQNNLETINDIEKYIKDKCQKNKSLYKTNSILTTTNL